MKGILSLTYYANEAPVTMMTFLFVSDAQYFTYPRFPNNVLKHASLLSHVDFTFTYKVPNKYQIGTITCGYEENYDYIVQKRRTRPAYVYPKYAGKAEVVSDKTGISLTIRLKNLKMKDSKDYLQCQLSYSGLAYYSGKYNLKVYGKYY